MNPKLEQGLVTGLMCCTLALTLAACGKKAPAPPPAQTSDAATATNATNEPLVGEVNRFMTEQLHIFIQQSGRLPTNFAEFANARLDSVPRKPPGMKWAIDPVTREVKLVKQ